MLMLQLLSISTCFDMFLVSTVVFPINKYIYMYIYIIPVVPHKAVAEVSKIGNL